MTWGCSLLPGWEDISCLLVLALVQTRVSRLPGWAGPRSPGAAHVRGGKAGDLPRLGRPQKSGPWGAGTGSGALRPAPGGGAGAAMPFPAILSASLVPVPGSRGAVRPRECTSVRGGSRGVTAGADRAARAPQGRPREPEGGIGVVEWKRERLRWCGRGCRSRPGRRRSDPVVLPAPFPSCAAASPLSPRKWRIGKCYLRKHMFSPLKAAPAGSPPPTPFFIRPKPHQGEFATTAVINPPADNWQENNTCAVYNVLWLFHVLYYNTNEQLYIRS